MRKNHSPTFLALSLALVVPLLCANCGETDPKVLTDAATEAIQSRDFKSGLASFDAALSHMDATSSQFMRASLGRCVALAHVDPAKGKTEFLKLAETMKAKIEPTDVHFVVSAFVTAGQIDLATDIMERMTALFPKSKEISDIGNSVADAAIKTGNTNAQSRLKGLGYGGSSK